VDITSEFEEWWKAFPGTDNFTHKGKKFSGDRTLRKTKEDCQLKFDKILEEGEYTAKDLYRFIESRCVTKEGEFCKDRD